VPRLRSSGGSRPRRRVEVAGQRAPAEKGDLNDISGDPCDDTLPGGGVRRKGQDKARALLRRPSRPTEGGTRSLATFDRSNHGQGQGQHGAGRRFRVDWEETFQLPGKYRRLVEGKAAERMFSLEYGVIENKGWLRQNKGEPMPFTGQKVPLERRWNAFLALLPALLDGGAKLSWESP